VHLTQPAAGAPGEGRWHWTNESYPADAVSLRSISSDNFVVVDTTAGKKVIGETDFSSGPSTLHEKAIYIVEGRLHQVERLDFEGRKAYVRQVDCDYYTDAITYTRVTILDLFEEGWQEQADEGGKDDAPREAVARAGTGAAVPAHGEVHVVSRVVGFKKIKFYTNENVGSGELDLPEQQMHTTAYWFTVPREVMAGLRFATDERRDGVVGLSFAVRQVAQLLLMCDGHDIGISIGSGKEGETTAPGGEVDCDEPRIFVYDNYPGGIGFSAPLYGWHSWLLNRTRDLIAGCPCDSGCPSCVGPVGNTGPLAKKVALAILEKIA
jgi:DEAD/DEAH box helicase domain-containing protein